MSNSSAVAKEEPIHATYNQWFRSSIALRGYHFGLIKTARPEARAELRLEVPPTDVYF
jgi:hypothetical protein